MIRGESLGDADLIGDEERISLPLSTSFEFLLLIVLVKLLGLYSNSIRFLFLGLYRLNYEIRVLIGL